MYLANDRQALEAIRCGVDARILPYSFQVFQKQNFYILRHFYRDRIEELWRICIVIDECSLVVVVVA